MKRRLTAIKFDKERLITKLGYLDHNSQKVTHERLIFNSDALADEVEKFLKGLIERHYPLKTDYDFTVNQISLDYDEFKEPCKLTFSLRFNEESCGEMSLSFPSLPHQIVERNSDLIESLSDFAIAEWDDFYNSLPVQGDLNLFPLPELVQVEAA
jgi:hypothetical protein